MRADLSHLAGGLPSTSNVATEPIEPTWRDLKRHHLAHQTFTGPNDLDRAIHDAVTKLNAERSRHPSGSQQIAA